MAKEYGLSPELLAKCIGIENAKHVMDGDLDYRAEVEYGITETTPEGARARTYKHTGRATLFVELNDALIFHDYENTPNGR